MDVKAIVMMMVGFILLYGGLFSCVAIAIYHEKNRKLNQK